MPRRKIPISLIGNPRTRAATFAKRKEGLKKKARELAVLCGVPVALVCAGGPGGGAAEVWASEEGILERYRALPAETRAGHTHRRYLEDELGKVRAKLARRRQDGPDALTPWDAALNEMTLGEARELLETVDAALRATSERRKALGLPADGGSPEQPVPDASNAVVPFGHGVQCIGSNSVNVDGGHHLQMMPGDGSSDPYAAPLACDDGFWLQPHNAGMMQRGHSFQCTDGSYVGTHGHQMQAPGNGNVQDGWLNLAMWRADESSNAIVPVGYPVSLDIGSNFIDDTPAQHPADGTGGGFLNAPVGFLATPMGITGDNFMSMHGYETQSSAQEFQRFDTSLDQLHYLNDLADGMRLGSEDTQLRQWGSY